MPTEEDEDLPQVERGNFSSETVQQRVDDWLRRLNMFFEENKNWAAQHGWSAESAGEVQMHEELMRDFSVPPAHQPTLRLDSPRGTYALFKPKGLWVFGANGRIDLYTNKGAYIIVDQAERFQPPKWRIFRHDSRREGSPYNPDLLTELA